MEAYRKSADAFLKLWHAGAAPGVHWLGGLGVTPNGWALTVTPLNPGEALPPAAILHRERRTKK